MQSLLPVLGASVETGLIFALLSIGVVITYKILKISDLSLEGTFPLGAFLFAKLATAQMNPYAGMVLAFAGGLLGGLVTYLLYKKLRIEALLAGILTMTMLYSINLKVTGQANVPLMSTPSVFTNFEMVPKIVLLAVVVLVVKLLLDAFLQTERGYLLYVTGDNESLVKALGQNPDRYTMLGLMLSNGIIALSGALMAQYSGFADSAMGATMIVTGLASIIIGDTVLKHHTGLKVTTRAILGAVVYRIIAGLALHLGLDPQSLKLITALIVVVFIAYNNGASNYARLWQRNAKAHGAWRHNNA
ncbi:ABC transporter permease [Peptoniphilus equinus]|uniref:ABC transporter permease n=1 Tax=Peptoniphilus equinus TaxID=3016343 RepID=A0ABY7QW29_9FIRM|nr:ABC transporter permease [Peptoniphilus equinus]WBW50294.1 ABC transporter permease [Peptoniphilus equinus]